MRDADDLILSLRVYAQAHNIDGNRYAHRRSTLSHSQEEPTSPLIDPSDCCAIVLMVVPEYVGRCEEI